jgi:hypothetical protein
MNANVVVKFSAQTLASSDLHQRARQLVTLVPGSRIERISKRGRVVLRLPASAAIDEAIKILEKVSGVEYAEQDIIDHATASEHN